MFFFLCRPSKLREAYAFLLLTVFLDYTSVYTSALGSSCPVLNRDMHRLNVYSHASYTELSDVKTSITAWLHDFSHRFVHARRKREDRGPAVRKGRPRRASMVWDRIRRTPASRAVFQTVVKKTVQDIAREQASTDEEFSLARMLGQSYCSLIVVAMK
jgi:hypothetical protein